MSDGVGPEFHFGSPRPRRATIYLEHVAGFEVAEGEGSKLIIPSDLEEDTDGNPAFLREILGMSEQETRKLTQEYLLRHLALPNLPLGIIGDPTREPAVLGSDIQIRPVVELDPVHRPRTANFVSMVIRPTLGEILNVSYARYPKLGGYGMEGMVTGPDYTALSLHQNEFFVEIGYTPTNPSHEAEQFS